MGYYEDLDIDKQATPSDIKKAYRKLALQHHPDKGGDPEKFKQIGTAYECLSDPEKKKRYDMFGEVDEGQFNHPDPFDIFSMFFNQRPPAAHHRQKKGRPIVHHISLSLEELYVGKNKTFNISSRKKCKTCKASGCKKDKTPTTCATCSGKGMTFAVKDLGMFQTHVQQICNMCHGQGSFISRADRCPTCNGSKLHEYKKQFKITIKPGMKDDDNIILKEEGDEFLDDVIPGDIIFIIRELKHDVFLRKNKDLYFRKDITLVEALTGVNFILTTLDNRKIEICRDLIINPETTFKIKNEGMCKKGNLCIIFNIEFPTKKLDEQSKEFIKLALV